ncbi:MAG: helicase-related protein [Pseudonocardiaceae bacterium]
MIAEIADAGERALVFTQYRVMGEMLAQHLAEMLDREAVPFLHGGLPSARRDQLVTVFQETADASPVLVVSLRAAGYGLTLTRANHVLHYDRWWNPAVEDQASDRVHRIGQRQPVTVHTLLTEGTVEEHIARLHEDKRGLAAVVTDRSEAALAELPDRDLRAVLELTSLGED